MEARLARGETVLRVILDGSGRVRVFDGDGEPEAFSVRRLPDGRFVVETSSGLRPADGVRNGDSIWVRLEGRTYRYQLVRGRVARPPGPGDLASPMPGRVQMILVREGAEVKAEDPLLVVEAMKMQLEIKAPRAGRVRLLAREGDQVLAGAPLAEIEAVP